MSERATADPERYSRQVRFAPIGAAGQERLAAARVGVAGCGALGSTLAERLVRAGVGFVRIVDRDFVELSNLPRQALFDEADVAARLPKAEAAARHLRAANGACALEAWVQDLSPANVRRFVAGLDVVVDGLDNFEARFMVNDACVAAGVPWVYGGVVGATGMWMAVRPGVTACLRCLMPEPPAPGALPTCETEGVLGTAPTVVAAFQATAAIKLLLDVPAATAGGLVHVDLWRDVWQSIAVARDPHCRSCGTREFPHLDRRATVMTVALCGRNAVQVTPPGTPEVSLAALRERLAGVTRVEDNGYLLAFEVEGHEVVVFADGRAVVQGTTDESRARALYARYIGS